MCRITLTAFLAAVVAWNACGQFPPQMNETMAVEIVRQGGQNTLYKGGVKLNRRSAKLVMAAWPDARAALEGAYRSRAVAKGFSYTGGAIVCTGVGIACGGENLAASLTLAGIGAGIAAFSTPFYKRYNTLTGRAADIYNRGVFGMAPTTGARLDWGMTTTGGLGLLLVF